MNIRKTMVVLLLCLCAVIPTRSNAQWISDSVVNQMDDSVQHVLYTQTTSGSENMTFALVCGKTDYSKTPSPTLVLQSSILFDWDVVFDEKVSSIGVRIDSTKAKVHRVDRISSNAVRFYGVFDLKSVNQIRIFVTDIFDKVHMFSFNRDFTEAYKFVNSCGK